MEADLAREPYLSPLWHLEAVVARKDGKGRVWKEKEKVTREQALWMHTNWAAYYFAEEDKLGTIEVGKLADLVVLDGDYLRVPEEQISEIPIVLTMVGGRIVYEAGAN